MEENNDLPTPSADEIIDTIMKDSNTNEGSPSVEGFQDFLRSLGQNSKKVRVVDKNGKISEKSAGSRKQRREQQRKAEKEQAKQAQLKEARQRRMQQKKLLKEKTSPVQ
jgi:hypothetical protein